MKIQFLLISIFLFLYSCNKESNPDTDMLDIFINFQDSVGEMTDAWAWFGYDESNYTYMHDGRKLLTELSELSPSPVYVRTHNLLVSGDGKPALKWGSTNIYSEDENGNAVYEWNLIDSIFDAYIERGMRPLVEIGFMPEALSSNPEPYKHHWKPGAKYNEIYTGWAYPPEDYQKWAELVFRWVIHCVERYGEDEVQSWNWEVWNEPNIGYWQGSAEEYHKLYDYTSDAVKRAFPKARIGGPHSTGPSWDKAEEFLRTFLDHCLNGVNYATGSTGSPLDFIAFHAKGSPVVKDGVVLMNMGTQLRDVSKGFEIVSSYSEFMHLPVIIGECDPEGCAACSMKDYPENAYRNGTMYSSYTAASFARIYQLADHYGTNLEGIVTWAFEFEDQSYFNGFRSLATNGIDKPVLNVFRMFGKMQGIRVNVSGDLAYDCFAVRESSVRGANRDINAIATVNDSMAAIMVWNYHDLNVIRKDTIVRIRFNGLEPGKAMISHYRIDQDHSNAYTFWEEMGSPQDPDPDLYSRLEEKGKLALMEQKKIKIRKGDTSLLVPMEGQAVSLFVLKW
jgi:xylan 1,4-beta-xylosidase